MLDEVGEGVQKWVMFWLVVGVNLFFLIIVLHNFVFAYRFRPKKEVKFPSPKPRVSVLVPARNEAENIGQLVETILKQQGIDLELLVLDDGSVDDTWDQLQNLRKAFSQSVNSANIKNFAILNGQKLPSGWTGKNWACWQLVAKAKYDFLLFLDADVALESPWTLAEAVLEMQRRQADLLSIVPTQRMKSLGERLVVPLMTWIFLTFLPIQGVYKSSRPSLSAANGQFMLFKKPAYLQSGGHQSVQSSLVEDIELARRFKRLGQKTLLMIGTGGVSCRMYSSLRESLNGFSKNLFLAMGTSSLVFMFVLLCIQTIFLLPFLLVWWNTMYWWAILIILLGRLVVALISNQNVLLSIILHPVQMFFLGFVALKSWHKTKYGQVEWKHRKYNFHSELSELEQRLDFLQ